MKMLESVNKQFDIVADKMTDTDTTNEVGFGDHDFESIFERTYAPDSDLKANIRVERDVLPIAIRHGMELWWDGSTPTHRLDDRDGSSQFTRFVNGRIEGKLAEVAFSKLLYDNFGVRSKVDWRIYGDYEVTDEGDLQHLLDEDGNEVPLGVDVDIKKTKPWNSWLAVREEIFRNIDKDAPVILTKLRIEDDIQLDQWDSTDDWATVDSDQEFRNRLLTFADDMFPLDVEFVGTAYPDEFNESFDKGDRLYDPVTGKDIGPPLKRSNEGIFVENLDCRAIRWNRIVHELTEHLPNDSWRPLPIVDMD